MTFRYARHTNNLNKIEKFYTQIIRLEILGGFENHNNYNGLFLGFKNSNWHLEFTISKELPNNKFDEDDILVFYVNSEIELSLIKKRIIDKNLILENPKNPYWEDNGIMISDPDGFKIVLSIKQLCFNSNDELTKLIHEKNIDNWSNLIDFTRNLPYGRNSNREDLSLVIKENKGTCSSKHAFLKKVANLNNFENVKLILGIYQMNELNTPKIGNTISKNNLVYIPEAHCYLKLNNIRIDITSNKSDIELLMPYIVPARKLNIFKN